MQTKTGSKDLSLPQDVVLPLSDAGSDDSIWFCHPELFNVILYAVPNVLETLL